MPDCSGLQLEIAGDGSYIHWPVEDIHLDLDSLRYAADPKYRSRSNETRLIADKKFGAAVAVLRTSIGLKQAAISGLSERQVRRIEHGERPTSLSLTRLAEAHGFALDEYLTKLAEIMRTSNVRESARKA